MKQRKNNAGRRFLTQEDFTFLTAKKPYKKLTSVLSRKAGRSFGKISTRHKGGGHKRLYRLVDFNLNYPVKSATVKTVEYDPNRTAFISLIEYDDGLKSYIIAPEGIKPNNKIEISNAKEQNSLGNRMPLKYITPATPIHNIELRPQGGGKVARSAGAYGMITSIEGGYATVKLKSGEVRKISENCRASIGVVSNVKHSQVVIGKAGRQRWKGVRPTVRGKAMYPAAHPHGGGEGNSPIGLKHPKTYKGKPAIGVKTRRKKKISTKFIIKRRGKK
ncbi:MAG: 50S ribosomal protein L2 [Berkelbacteria bacterium GW2011_GWA2_35_9]|uniref:Large ribosomal subunit protein uL2 n=1 Tax=Berkelbacteria bacterium GW2011_GWA2_35_9 TaxID=1618333 RepID=A0A0G0FP75_9BACT|nr:MAG: 50S ribosomal protein L2 [Berkelbacteria bacterium GW2011_GWA2_35_9]